jgi:hypothetical protein
VFTLTFKNIIPFLFYLPRAHTHLSPTATYECLPETALALTPEPRRRPLSAEPRRSSLLAARAHTDLAASRDHVGHPRRRQRGRHRERSSPSLMMAKSIFLCTLEHLQFAESMIGAFSNKKPVVGFLTN